MDKKIMETIVNRFSGGPVGVASLAVSVGEEQDTIEEVYEPYLIQAGYLSRTPREGWLPAWRYSVFRMEVPHDIQEDCLMVTGISERLMRLFRDGL